MNGAKFMLNVLYLKNITENVKKKVEGEGRMMTQGVKTRVVIASVAKKTARGKNRSRRLEARGGGSGSEKVVDEPGPSTSDQSYITLLN